MYDNERQQFESLEQRPRSLPGPLWARLCFGGWLALVGWILLLMIFVFGLAFGAKDLVQRSLPLAYAGVTQTTGEVQSIVSTSVEVNDRQIMHCIFTYTVDGRTYRGDSYVGEHRVEHVMTLPYTVPVVYVTNRPNIANIQGQNAAVVGLWMLYMMAGLGLFAFILLLFNLVGGFRKAMIVSRGDVTFATYADKTSTSTKINDMPVWAFRFLFDVDGQTHELTVKTHLTDKMTEGYEKAVFYLPDAPEQAVLFDALPLTTTVEQGRLRSKGGRFWLIVPAVFCVLVLMGTAMMMN